mgnify:CR=1 FL=1
MTRPATADITLEAIRRQARARLEAAGVGESAAADVDHLLSAATGLARTHFRAYPEAPLEPAAHERFEALLRRREAGEPVAYLIGRRGFRDFDLRVAPDVLIPRPETEHLVEAALETPADSVLDLGCGSGCVALALARAWPQAAIDAVDISPGALAIARDNANRLAVDNIDFLAGDWFAPVAGRRYDLIVANPPYIGAAEPAANCGDLRFEPRAALVSGPTGLEALQLIIRQAPAQLRPAGRLWVEHGWTQGAAVRTALRKAGFQAVHTRHDLAGHERISGGHWQGYTSDG